MDQSCWDSHDTSLAGGGSTAVGAFSPCPLYDNKRGCKPCVCTKCPYKWLLVIRTSAAVQPGRGKHPGPRGGHGPHPPTAGSALAKTGPAGPGAPQAGDRHRSGWGRRERAAPRPGHQPPGVRRAVASSIHVACPSTTRLGFLLRLRGISCGDGDRPAGASLWEAPSLHVAPKYRRQWP